MKRIYVKEELEKIIKECVSIAGVCRRIGIRPIGGNYRTINEKIKIFGLNTSHFTGQLWSKGKKVGPKYKVSLQDRLTINSNYNSHKLKLRLLENGIKQHKCECCLQISWLDRKIPLELDHINGVNTDNRIENLRLLCPNCHAFTSNYRGRKKEKSALSEMRDVEYRKFGETPVCLKRGNPEPSDLKNKIEGVETRHDKPKVFKFCKTCNKQITIKNKIYCSLECYRNNRSEKIPKVPEILDAFKKYKSYVQVGKHFGVCDNSVKKWIIKYGIEAMVKV